jgi:hypothetical protein
MDLGAAREKVRVAKRLAELPAIDQALARGEISYCKVRAMTRVATADNEADLLGMARNTTGSQLERICRLKRSVDRLDNDAAREQEDCRRYVVQRSTDDGMESVVHGFPGCTANDDDHDTSGFHDNHAASRGNPCHSGRLRPAVHARDDELGLRESVDDSAGRVPRHPDHLAALSGVAGYGRRSAYVVQHHERLTGRIAGWWCI